MCGMTIKSVWACHNLIGGYYFLIKNSQLSLIQNQKGQLLQLEALPVDTQYVAYRIKPHAYQAERGLAGYFVEHFLKNKCVHLIEP